MNFVPASPCYSDQMDTNTGPNLEKQYSNIQPHNRVLDAYGHLSVRHPHKKDRMFMSRYIAPATISSERDLVEYYIDTAEPVDPNSPKGYSERCIHSEVLKKFPDVNAVIHSHSEAVVPYTISGVPMQPCFHMAGFLGTHIPVYDIAQYYQDGDAQDMLVRNTRLGAALASHFSTETSSEGKGSPDYPVVLMRGHGLTVAGPSIQEAVLRAVYTQQNAAIQTTALITRAAHFGPSGMNGQGNLPQIHYLNDQESKDALEMTKWSAYRPWGLWLREVEAMGLYVNTA
jgi:ribulose-5-phosphate 4-epimerase/fuculose-1-phosphate aldolase